MPTQSKKAPKNIFQQIFEDLGIEKLSEETQITLVTRLTELFLKRITVDILEQLSETEREEFLQIKNSGDSEKMLAFLRGKIPDYDQMVQKEIKEFKKEMKKKFKDSLKDLGIV